MSKLAIFLCVVLFASAANASYWTDAVEAVQNKVGEIVESAVNEVKNRFNDARIKAEEIARKLMDEAQKIGKNIKDNIQNILQKAEDQIDQLTANAEGVDVTECTQLFAHLEYTALAVIANMSVCITEKLETGSGYIESMIKISEDIISNLTNIREDAYHCGENVDGFRSAGAAIVCANLAAAKATWVSAKVVPEMAVKMAKLGVLLGTLQPTLAYCTTSHGLVTFYEESSTIVDRTRKCIQEKIDEARATTPRVDHTYPTEHNYPNEHEHTTEHNYPNEHEHTTEHNYPNEHEHTTEHNYPNEHEHTTEKKYPEEHEYTTEKQYPEEHEYTTEKKYPEEHEYTTEKKYPEEHEYTTEKEYSNEHLQHHEVNLQ